MAYINYPASSAYAGTPQGGSFIGRYKHRKISPSTGDKYIVIEPKYNLRPDLLAYDLYGDSSYWWVFCSRNIDLVRDPVWDFTTGKEIVVPSMTHLKASIG